MLALISGAGVLLLLRSWRGTQKPAWLVWTGWLLIALSLVCSAYLLGPVRGPFIALALVSVVALCIVGSNYTLRQTKQRTSRTALAPEPSDRATTNWRETTRWFLAGPIGMIAAMGVGIAYATLVPGEPQTRLVIGGLIVPVAWGGCMAWTLADNRIIRATAVLVGVTLISFSAAILKGFA